jgi:hypothetical protein
MGHLCDPLCRRCGVGTRVDVYKSKKIVEEIPLVDKKDVAR